MASSECVITHQLVDKMVEYLKIHCVICIMYSIKGKMLVRLKCIVFVI